ncbi:uncharacterized protein LOC118468417 [Anopheles albimanus]|uniref:DUF4794 domain-containing protein n=1 Tax=Anopheles albimanus TaxID=7167 RepID=A0A182F5T0_ANOAL|nr:uncharacterized protein LOC118468417 [Anopheles albimanus]
MAHVPFAGRWSPGLWHVCLLSVIIWQLADARAGSRWRKPIGRALVHKSDDSSYYETDSDSDSEDADNGDDSSVPLGPYSKDTSSVEIEFDDSDEQQEHHHLGHSLPAGYSSSEAESGEEEDEQANLIAQLTTHGLSHGTGKTKKHKGRSASQPPPVTIAVPYPVHVERKVPVFIETKVPVYVEKKVEVPVDRPYQVPVYHREVVHVPKPVIFNVDRPYPVYVPRTIVKYGPVRVRINSRSRY